MWLVGWAKPLFLKNPGLIFISISPVFSNPNPPEPFGIYRKSITQLGLFSKYLDLENINILKSRAVKHRWALDLLTVPRTYLVILDYGAFYPKMAC